MKIVLETERLYLREFTPEDAQLLVDLNSNPNVTRYTGDGPVNLAEAQKIILDVILPQYKNKLGRWAVHLKSNHEFIGWCGLKHILEVDEIDLGYRFFEPHWGKAYATESALACFNYGIQKLGLKTIVGRAAIENIASRKVLEKTGMSYIGDDIEHGNKIAKYRFSV